MKIIHEWSFMKMNDHFLGFRLQTQRDRRPAIEFIFGLPNVLVMLQNVTKVNWVKKILTEQRATGQNK